MNIDISKWPEKPYRWMAEDLHKSLNAKANYLVGLGLFCYTEVLGKKILEFREPEKNFWNNRYNRPAFNLFLGEYMGYQDIIDNSQDKVYDWFLNGLKHQYFIKGSNSGVYLYFDSPSEKKLRERGIDTNKGLIILDGNNILLAQIYFNHFLTGIQEFLQESEQLN